MEQRLADPDKLVHAIQGVLVQPHDTCKKINGNLVRNLSLLNNFWCSLNVDDLLYFTITIRKLMKLLAV